MVTVVVECDKYETDRREMRQVIVTKLGHNLDERMEKTGRKSMVLLLELCKETTEKDDWSQG